MRNTRGLLRGGDVRKLRGLGHGEFRTTVGVLEPDLTENYRENVRAIDHGVSKTTPFHSGSILFMAPVHGLLRTPNTPCPGRCPHSLYSIGLHTVVRKHRLATIT
jgi:hypothetical protein